MCCSNSDFVDEFDNDKLHDVTEGVQLIDAGDKVVEGTLLIDVDEHHKGVALA